MNYRIHRSLIALAVAAGVSLSGGLVRPALADDVPHLELAVQSLPDAANPRTVVFKVTNTTEIWADETTASVETSRAGGTLFTGGRNEQENIFIENLDPGQSTTFTYMLTEDCDGHRLRAVVRPAKNYAGETESPTAPENRPKNFDVCARIAAPAGIDPDDDVDMGGCGYCGPQAKPEAAPVTADIPMTEYYIRYSGQKASGPGAKFIPSPPNSPAVGWAQDDGGWWIWHLGIHFDLNVLRLAGATSDDIVSATITYKESPDRWTSGSGANQTKPGCVTRISLSQNLTPPGGDFVGPSTPIGSVDPGRRSIDVFDAVRNQRGRPGASANQVNFVLRGAMDSLRGDDDTSCTSDLTEIVLHVTYKP